MSKFTKKLAAVVLAAAMLATSASIAFADSPTGGNTDTSSATKVVTVKKSSKAAVKSGTVTEKYDTVTLVLWRRNKVKSNVLKGDGKQAGTVFITKAKGAKKLYAKRFSAKAFKGYTGKIVVKKSAMTKSEYKKLKKKLKSGGFKGKISYKK